MITTVIDQARQRLSQSSAAICGAARNCRAALAVNLKRADDLARHCAKSIVVVVENDSTDGTKDLLHKESDGRDDFAYVELDGLVTPPEEKPFDRSRIQRIADCRNACLDRVDTLDWTPDYLIVWDWDLADVEINGLLDSFNRADDWDAVTANGKTIHWLHQFWKGYKYADCYAYRELGWAGAQDLDRIERCRHALSCLKPGMPMIRVASAFGGLAIYRYAAIRGLRYRVVDNANPDIPVLCEHDTFHRDMAARGADRMFINPAMVVYYDTYFDRLKRLI